MALGLLAGTSTALLLAGCAGGGPIDATPAGGDSGVTTIRTQINAAPDSFLPFAARAGSANYVNALLYSTLVYQDENHELAPGLATGWEAEPTRAELTIRDDATCADGTAITPTVVKTSLDAFASQSPTAGLVFGPQSPLITADDEAGTVEVALETPWADLLQGLSLQATGVVCPAGFADVEATGRGEVEGAFSGPYVVDKVRPGVEVRLAQREDFIAWPEYAEPLSGRPAQTVVFAINDDPAAISNALLTSELDVAPVTGKELARFEQDDAFELQMIPRASVFVVFNQREGKVFADEAKRKAVLQAIDRQQFIDAAGGGVGEIAASFVPPSVECAVTDTKLPAAYDPEAAKSVLDGVSFEMLGTQGLGPLGNPFVETALREVGANPTLRVVDNTAWNTEMGTSPDSWDLSIVPLTNVARTMFGGMLQMVGAPTEAGGRNWSGTPKPDVLELVGKAMAAPDTEARCAMYEQAQQLMLGRADFAPLSHAVQVNVLRDGFDMRVTNGNPWTITLRITD